MISRLALIVSIVAATTACSTLQDAADTSTADSVSPTGVKEATAPATEPPTTTSPTTTPPSTEATTTTVAETTTTKESTTTTSAPSTEDLSFVEAREFLRVVLQDEIAAASEPAQARIEILPDLFGAVVLANPGGPIPVTTADLERWDRGLGAIYSTALDQTLSYTLELLPSEGVDFFEGSSFDADLYKGIQILTLETYLDPSAEAGHLIGVPIREMMYSVPVSTLSTKADLDLAAESNYRLYLTGPDPVSADLYWWIDGALQPIQVSEDTIVYPVELEDLFDE